MAKVGRPKKYTPEFLKKEAKNLLAWLDEHSKDKVIWFKDFAIENGYSAQRLSEFAEASEEFSEALKKAYEIQESKLARGSLENKLNNATSIFLLKSVHGHQDKVSMEHTGADGKDLNLTIEFTPCKKRK